MFCARKLIGGGTAEESCKSMTLATVEIECRTCGFQIPPFAGREILRTDTLQTVEHECPTCKSVFRVCVQQTRRTTLTAAKLEEIRNKNR